MKLEKTIYGYKPECKVCGNVREDRINLEGDDLVCFICGTKINFEQAKAEADAE